MTTPPTPIDVKRGRPGRPKVIEDVARLWLRVDSTVKERAAVRAASDGHPDLTTAIRELVTAYAEGRVVIRKRPPR